MDLGPPLPNHSASGPYTHTKPLVLTFDASSEMSTKLWNRWSLCILTSAHACISTESICQGLNGLDLGPPLPNHSASGPYTHTGSVSVWSFPRKNADRLKKIGTRTRKLSDLEHGCRIPPELADITCASQGRATPRSDFPRITARKTILLHFRCSHETTRSGLEQINLQTRGLARLWDTILTFSTRCFPGTRRNNDPATGRRRHRRSIN